MVALNPLFYPAWPINIFGIKVMGVESSSSFNVGPSAQWGFNSIAKTNQWNSASGDLSNTPVLYGFQSDNDYKDTPVFDFWPY